MNAQRWRVIRCLALGPAMATVGYLAAVILQATRGPVPALFTPEFHDQYRGLWLVNGGIGLAIGVWTLIFRPKG